MDKKPVDEKELQQKYMELQMLSSQIRQLQKAMQMLEEQSLEIQAVSESLDTLKDSKKGTEILIPVTSGIFMKGSIEDTANLVVSVGSNVAVSKDLDSTKKLLEERQKEIGAEKDEMMLQLQGMVQLAQQHQDAVEKLAAELE